MIKHLAGPISLGDIFEVMPFRNTIDEMDVLGSTLHKVLELSVANWVPENPWGGFLQFSGAIRNECFLT